MPVAADTTTKVEQIKKTKKVKKQAVKGEPAVESKKAEKSKKEVGPEGTKKAQKSREIKAAKKIAKQAAAKKYYEDNPEKVVVEAPVVEDKVEVEEKVEVKVVKTIRKKVDADAPLKSRNTLFVRNIPFSASTQQLEEHFSEVGPIRSCFIVTDGDKSKGFGYCQFAINEDATRALEKTAFEGKVLKIELSNRRPGRDDEKPTSRAVNPRPTTQLHNIKCSKPSIVVRNLAFHTTEAIIREAFGQHGTIENLRMAYKHDQGEKKFRGFCFIDFKEMKEADNAIKELNGKKIANRIVAVDYSLPKEKYDQIQAQGEAASKETADVQEGEDHDDMEVDGDEASGDESMDDDEVEEEVEVEKKPALRGDPGAMLFIRNLSFDSTEDELRDLFAKFGLIKYARITKDKITGASRGSGFVCFKTKEDYATCLEAFGTAVSESSNIQSSTSTTIMVADPSSSASSSPFILAGRFLNVAPALVKSEAAKITLEKSEQRIKSDKRNLYLMKEGVIYPDSPAGLLIPASEMSKRQASFALRRKLLNENPNLFISKNRLSVRNLGKSIDDAFLKYLARYATIGFWKQVDASERAPLEQVVLQGEEGEGPVVPPSDERRVIIKQAKIVRDQEKINPKTNEGKSKGYGFIEFTNHADALACLRWLNNNGMAIPIARKKREKLEGEVKADKMTPIVEFAMENVLVLRKRTQRKDGEGEREERGAAEEGKSNKAGKKRKREAREAAAEKESASKGKDGKKKKYFH